MTPAQKRTLAEIHKSGFTRAKQKTMDVLMEKGYVVVSDDGFSLTKKGLRIAEGRAGGNLPEIKKKDLRSHLKQRKPIKKKRDRATTAKEKKEHLEELRKHHEEADVKREKALGRILGPSGITGAVKISKASGEPFRAEDVDELQSQGWNVASAGSVSARPGTTGIKGILFSENDWTFKNPETLGPNGTARALVLIGRIDAPMVDELASYGFDVAAAPKKIREAIKNPATSPVQKKVFEALKASAKRNRALRIDEVAEKIKTPLALVADAINRLSTLGMVHEAGRDLFGPCYYPGAPQRGLFENPSAKAKAEKKARAWYGKDELVTEAQEIDWTPPKSAVHIGQFVAIEYLSDKFDGTKRIYRHDVTHVRQMLLSPDGSTIIVDPPFKITKRGIEG